MIGNNFSLKKMIAISGCLLIIITTAEVILPGTPTNSKPRNTKTRAWSTAGGEDDQ